MKYVITLIDRTSRWPEAFPTASITAKRVANILVTNWILRFGVPATVTTDQGRQFEVDLLTRLAALCGIRHTPTTAYHPQANGRVERWHRSLKVAIKAYETVNWVGVLPMLLLRLRTAVHEDQNMSPAQLTYGAELRLPCDFFVSSAEIEDSPYFVKEL